MTPYFERNGIAIYHADSRQIGLELEGDMLLGDPPYGISHRCGHHTDKTPRARNIKRFGPWMPTSGENEPFDPVPWLRFSKIALFGANYFSSRLPDAKCWIVWDKKGGSSDPNADCELAWTNFTRSSRIFFHLWRGLIRAGEENAARGPKFHQFQKPVALMRNIIEYSRTAGPIIDPWVGSGTVLLAAFDLGFEAVGVDINEECCEIASKRLESRPRQLRLATPKYSWTKRKPRTSEILPRFGPV